MRGDRATVTGDGPTVELAQALRMLHRRKGLNQSELAKRCGYTAKTISTALKGADRPSWKVTHAIIAACAGTSADERRCKGLWDRADHARTTLQGLEPVATGAAVVSDTTQRLLEILRRRVITIDDLLQRTGCCRPPQIDGKPWWRRPSPQAITAVLAEGSRPPCRHIVMLVLTVCEASYGDMMCWLERLTGIEDAPCECDDPKSVALVAPSTTGVHGDVAVASTRAVDGAVPAMPAWGHGRQAAVWRLRSSARLLKALGAITVVMVGAVLVWVSARPSSEQRSSGGTRTAPGTIPSTPSADSTRGRPARKDLAELAARTARVADTSSTGPVIYVHTSSQRPDDSSARDEPFTDQDEQLWRRVDGSGLLRVTPLPPQGLDPAADPVQPGYAKTLRPGEVRAAVRELHTDQGILAERLHGLEPGTDSPAATLLTVGQLYRYNCPTPAQRAALLRVLADTTGLVATTDRQDRLGRTGLQVSTTEAKGRIEHRAVFDTDTGVLLGIESIRKPSPGDTLTPPTVAESTTFHTCRRQNSMG